MIPAEVVSGIRVIHKVSKQPGVILSSSVSPIGNILVEYRRLDYDEDGYTVFCEATDEWPLNSVSVDPFSPEEDS